MQIRKENPYEKCPIYETKQLVFRIVQEEDAEDLLECYSDVFSAKFFNNDNCTSNFIYQSLDEMKNCIRCWLDEYEKQCFIRFSIVDKKIKKAIGTIEFFPKHETFKDFGKVGVLRIDLASKYEKEGLITEILNMVEGNFYDCFEVESIITKAIPEAKQRIIALKNSDYQELNNNTIVSFDYYYIRVKRELL